MGDGRWEMGESGRQGDRLDVFCGREKWQVLQEEVFRGHSTQIWEEQEDRGEEVEEGEGWEEGWVGRGGVVGWEVGWSVGWEAGWSVGWGVGGGRGVGRGRGVGCLA